MATGTLISEAEYLASSYEDPIPEYAGGELIERSMPNNPHSRAQFKLALCVGMQSERLRLFPRPELRVRIAPGRYRIADLLVYADHEPAGAMPEEIPLVAVEIVSPDDKHEQVMAKLADYENWGVPHVWLVDPGLHSLAVDTKGSLTAVAAFELPERGFRIQAAEILD